MWRETVGGLLFSTLLLLFIPQSTAFAACSSGSNPIVCENSLAGNPPAEWDVAGAGDPNIQGFATDISLNVGQIVRFKIKTDASAYRIDIYRIGYYAGLGARLVATVRPSILLPQSQPACLSDSSTGLVDCGNWGESASWAVPSTAVSGVYIGKLVREDGIAGASHVVFIVRDDARASDLLFQTSDTTWQAYNRYGGNSLYTGSPAGRAYKVSYNRPFNTRVANPESWLFSAEYPMIRWLEANGYDVTYFTGVDSSRNGGAIRDHKVFLSVGHDEYWSAVQRSNVEAARDAGVHLAFFSGNSIFWKTRWENSIDGSNTPNRTLVCYKETHANAKIDPLPNVWTGTWRDPRFSPPADGGRPENALKGTIFSVNGPATFAIEVPDRYAKLRFWRNTSVATLGPGQTAVLADGTLGYEWDEDLDNGFRPPGLVQLSWTRKSVPQYLLDYGSTYGAGIATHSATLHRHPLGALVFSAGSVQWSWGLDGAHDGGGSTPDLAMRQATVNLFADMGVQPESLTSGLVPASPSSDVTAPRSTITSPASGSQVQFGVPMIVTGTATDFGGGTVAGVEVSTDGGATWHPASGTSSWTYSWTPNVIGTVTIKSSATDDSGNVEVPSPGVSVTVNNKCPCSIWTTAATPAVASNQDPQPVEVGVRFRSDVAGVITGIRFYKGAQNTGPHIGKLWTATGTLLASAAFSNETASGWQQVTFASPVSIAANTTYVASYHTASGFYSVTRPYFTTSVYTPPLRALADGDGGGNGVFQYGAGGLPTSSFNSTNYWVDVVFNNTAPPPSPTPTATALTPNSAPAGGPAFTLTVTGSNFVSGAVVRWNGAARTTTFGSSTQLTAAITATDIAITGTAQVSVANPDGQISNTLTFTITSASTCPCSIWTPAAAPAVASNQDPQPVEVGVRFRSDVAGVISGIRFYKGSQNTGPHTGKLWTATGTLLASAAFTNEIASGWQQVMFATPVSIAANTTYVASYHTASGFYSVTLPYFTTATYTPPLRALADGDGGGNGVFQYGAGGFPTSSFNATNYWVDVVFNNTAPPPSPAPTATALTPNSAPAGGPAFTLTVTGSNFVSGAVVRWNGAARTTTFGSSTQLTAAITAADIAAAGTVQVSVANPNGAASNSLPFTITTASSSFTLTVVKSGPGTVSSSPVGIDCGAVCSADYPVGSNVTLVATPGRNAIFIGWGGACSGTGTCSVTMDGAKSVTARFSKK